MAVSTVGVTKQTAERMLLDAGAIYKNLTRDETSGEWTGEALGATSGGNEFVVEIEQRQPEIDGVKSRIKGLSFVDTHEAHLVVNLKELTAQNIKNAIGPADIDTSDTNFDIITGRTSIKDEDYLENIAYVGRLSGTQKPVIIVLKNVISAEGFTMTSEDSNEAVIPITFNAHADFEDAQAGKTAYTIYWPKEGTVEGQDAGTQSIQTEDVTETGN
ncbi:hypothetical protein M3210_03025 [Oceanobacillus luteolus]|uniref:hypothetical protein n=1 Tax=Oceanobacillus luteolus TaxID=1274358 RepID=UPI00203F40A1|nr:hypothetical protein [Oceanobacillus luteolus]MCM3739236.1 hypothetical protein [Oceanobacillus luteolus]